MPTATAPQPDPNFPAAETINPPRAGVNEMWPPPYYAPPTQMPAPVRSTNVYAILAFVFAFLFWPVAIPLGHSARKQIARTGEQGSGLALAALVISYVCLAFVVLLIVLVVAATA
jgi:F0F1-type ATP synthase membrane subunit c/vacuolar-type H+-ATPase subunit K